ncbi:CPBP family intramembrane metalloprotease [Winogradskyella echinorum]|uniref:CPBP family intramembrane metalloprotease n=1 Tax=Winogradskyella echinorum TaxID=538189 RepID=A0ABR6Y0F0_9FLAO|nr:CPBP family intramembrane glutamic endopeptidase [Winogradskyella echinorum]MBC3846154.1 CPBP family intramembrane metalloprotease [Winogradskyella echinorum]MBC5750502.1 CPBP family intramembrane metalloprotease [Winogradskyella echinorum]
MHSVQYRLIEFFIVFIVIPISFVLQYQLWLKLTIGLLGFIYAIYVLLKVENNKFKLRKHINWKQFWQRTTIKLLVIIVITTLYVYLVDHKNLFVVIKSKPLFWLAILFIYSVFSVYPQELIYRTFFFQRYQSLFRSNTLFVFVNAAMFSLAHIFFRNILVSIFTFVGGLLFAITFKKTKSTLLVSIEHALYGCWLFTVGMGEMLGFPN